MISALLVGLIVLTGLCFFLVLVFRGGALTLLAIIGVPLVTLLYLVLARVTMEIVALFFRIGEDTSVIAGAVPVDASPPS